MRTSRYHGGMRAEKPTTDLPPNIGRQQITALILAGGRGSRMGGADKGLITLNGQPMAQHVIERLQPQVGTLLISANRNPEQYAEFGHRIVSDELDDYAGPLAGMLSGLRAARTEWLVVVPCDAPLVSELLVARLAAAVLTHNADIAVSHDGTRLQPMFLLLKCSLGDDIAAFLKAGERTVERWLYRHRLAIADFVDCPATFANVNDRLEHQRIEVSLKRAFNAR